MVGLHCAACYVAALSLNFHVPETFCSFLALHVEGGYEGNIDL
jgi:hypothetical protein